MQIKSPPRMVWTLQLSSVAAGAPLAEVWSSNSGDKGREGATHYSLLRICMAIFVGRSFQVVQEWCRFKDGRVGVFSERSATINFHAVVSNTRHRKARHGATESI